MSKFAKFYGQLYLRSLTSWIFAAVLTNRGRPLPFFLSMLPVMSMRLIRSQSILLLQFLAGNSRIIWTALYPSLSAKFWLKFCQLVSGAIFIS